jgi:hypothetical protein
VKQKYRGKKKKEKKEKKEKQTAGEDRRPPGTVKAEVRLEAGTTDGRGEKEHKQAEKTKAHRSTEACGEVSGRSAKEDGRAGRKIGAVAEEERRKSGRSAEEQAEGGGGAEQSRSSEARIEKWN